MSNSLGGAFSFGAIPVKVVTSFPSRTIARNGLPSGSISVPSKSSHTILACSSCLLCVSDSSVTVALLMPSTSPYVTRTTLTRFARRVEHSRIEASPVWVSTVTRVPAVSTHPAKMAATAASTTVFIVICLSPCRLNTCQAPQQGRPRQMRRAQQTPRRLSTKRASRPPQAEPAP